ncbi:hypothetical protein [Achromobacter sp. HZ28]|uniref:hypothetical protein n=1 Tax=Achromobacter sp. HZ28 TaxID=2015171 RepID=UPI001303485A|nr:hypothetical protein [Achromobacter sp. HZ28]
MATVHQAQSFAKRFHELGALAFIFARDIPETGAQRRADFLTRHLQSGRQLLQSLNYVIGVDRPFPRKLQKHRKICDLFLQ